MTSREDAESTKGKRVDLLLGLYVVGGAGAYLFAVVTDRRTWPILVVLGALLLPTVLLAPAADRSEAVRQWSVMVGVTFCTLVFAGLLLIWS